MKKLLTEWKKYLKEADWRDTSWSDEDGGNKVTIGEVDDYLGDKVINIPVQDLKKIVPKLGLERKRIDTADLKFPIIVVKWSGEYRYVLDGNHRLARAVEKNIESKGKEHKFIKARILDLDAPDIPERWKVHFLRPER
jgi:hypothetical protein